MLSLWLSVPAALEPLPSQLVSSTMERRSSLSISVNDPLWTEHLDADSDLFSQLRATFEADAAPMISLASQLKAHQDSNFLHKQSWDGTVGQHWWNYGCSAFKERAQFLFVRKLLSESTRKSTNNRELGELNETMAAREKRGSHPLKTLLCPGEWDKVSQYVHLPQLTAHIKKGLFKRGNNEKERVMENCASPLFLLQIYQD